MQLEDLHEGPDMDLDDEHTDLPGAHTPELLTTDGHLGTGWGSQQDSNARLLSHRCTAPSAEHAQQRAEH